MLTKFLDFDVLTFNGRDFLLARWGGVVRPGAPDMYWAKAHSESAGNLELEVVTRKFGRKLARYVVIVYSGPEIITSHELSEIG